MSEVKEKKPPLFPVFLFIGMGVGFLLIPVSPFAFISSMFVGMGLGFLLNEVVVIEERRIRMETPTKIGGIASMAIGALFIVGGILSIIAPNIVQQFATVFIGLGFRAVGLFIFFYGLDLLKAVKA